MIILKALSAVLAMLPGNADILTIDEAVAIALQNSYNVKNAQETVNSNEQKVREAAGGIGPKLTTNYQYLRYGHSSSAVLGGQTIVFTPLDTNTWSNQLTMPLDILGLWKANLKAAKAGVQSSRDSKIAMENDLKQAVRRAYLSVLRARGQVEIQTQTRVNIVARVDQATKQFNAGAIALIDLKRLQAQKSAVDSDVTNAQNSFQVSKQILNLTLNRAIETEFDVQNMSGMPKVPATPDQLAALGQEHRPETFSLANTVTALKAAKTYAGSSGAPSLNLTLNNNQVLDPVGLNPQRETNTAMIMLSIPIYDSGVARAKMGQVQATINQTINNLSLLKLNISQEVRAAITNMSNAMARQKSAIEQDELAKEVARIARIRRDAGEGTVLEIIDAETQWTTAQNNLVNAMYDYYNAYADLQRAVGADDIESALQKFETESKGKK